jgi:toxin ParE1/3/4
MTPIVFRSTARRDLVQSLIYIGERSPKASKKLLAKINRRIGQLKRNPELGPWRPEIGETARSLVVDPFVILYRVSSGQIEIVRILHGRRDIGPDLFRIGVSVP